MSFKQSLFAYRIGAFFVSAAIAIDLWANRGIANMLRYIRIDHEFFPFPFDQPIAYMIAMLLLIGSCVPILITRSATVLRYHAVSCLLLSFFLLCGQITHNDAAFVTSFWTSVWLAWLAASIPAAERIDWQQATLLAGLVISASFLLAAVGKTTERYFSGQVFYDLYVYEFRVEWALWVEALGPQFAELFFRWYSRMVLVGEFVAAGLILLPLRLIARAYIGLLVLMLLGSHYSVFAATGSFLGMMFAAEYLRRSNAIPAFAAQSNSDNCISAVEGEAQLTRDSGQSIS